MSKIFEEIKESLTMRQVAENFGFKPNKSGFILSPFADERTPSCKLYRNSFYDFSTNQGGDLVTFTATIIGSNNWQACQYLIKNFSLPYSLSGHIDNSNEIEKRKREQKEKQEKECRFKEAWKAEADKLKTWEELYKLTIERKIFSPFSEMQEFLVSELQKTSYKLDVLSGLLGNRAEQEKILIESGWRF